MSTGPIEALVEEKRALEGRIAYLDKITIRHPGGYRRGFAWKTTTLFSLVNFRSAGNSAFEEVPDWLEGAIQDTLRADLARKRAELAACTETLDRAGQALTPKEN